MLARHSGMTARGPKAIVAYWLIPAEAPLAQLSHALQQASAFHDRYDLNPHLSLIYKKTAQMAKLDVSTSVRLPFTEVLFDLAKAVICPVQTESQRLTE
jgi:hypothetical protein